MRHRTKIGPVNLILISMLVMWPLAAMAQEVATPPPYQSDAEVQIAIYPQGKDDGSRFEITANPGESVEVAANLSNLGVEPIELITYVGNIVPVANGGIKMVPRDTPANGSALWIEYPKEEVTLAPGESIERLIRVTVPEETAPGQYVNAIALETKNPVGGSGSSTIRQFIRKVVSIYVTVPGEVIAEFHTGEPEVLVVDGRAGIQIPLVNSGNVRVDLVGNLKLENAEGDIVYEGETTLGPIYMGQESVIQIPLAVVPAPGEYQLTYTFTDSNSQVASSSENLLVEVPEDTGASVQKPVAFNDVVIAPNADPIVFADVSLDITVTESIFRSTRLTMSVSRDGEVVEDFVLAENLVLNPGSTTVSQRYLPAAGWESGTYTFSFKLESMESGQSSLILDEKDVVSMEVP